MSRSLSKQRQRGKRENSSHDEQSTQLEYVSKPTRKWQQRAFYIPDQARHSSKSNDTHPDSEVPVRIDLPTLSLGKVLAPWGPRAEQNDSCSGAIDSFSVERCRYLVTGKIITNDRAMKTSHQVEASASSPQGKLSICSTITLTQRL